MATTATITIARARMLAAEIFDDPVVDIIDDSQKSFLIDKA